mmetsp:Transcript_5234/g.11453  ORF Transcript_5234/g.11453 Transcript_5234/m.11453 type:complete len:289 (-) Transcript_5234:320-1186(-)
MSTHRLNTCPTGSVRLWALPRCLCHLPVGFCHLVEHSLSQLLGHVRVGGGHPLEQPLLRLQRRLVVAGGCLQHLHLVIRLLGAHEGEDAETVVGVWQLGKIGVCMLQNRLIVLAGLIKLLLALQEPSHVVVAVGQDVAALDVSLQAMQVHVGPLCVLLCQLDGLHEVRDACVLVSMVTKALAPVPTQLVYHGVLRLQLGTECQTSLDDLIVLLQVSLSLAVQGEHGVKKHYKVCLCKHGVILVFIIVKGHLKQVANQLQLFFEALLPSTSHLIDLNGLGKELQALLRF